jgi:hypothetical protein
LDVVVRLLYRYVGLRALLYKQATRVFYGGNVMKKQTAGWIMVLVLLVLVLVAAPQDRAQTTKAAPATSASQSADAQKKNLQAYIELLRQDVGQQKAEMMGSVMALSATDAAKFWPIYSEYDAELTKINDLRVANIQEYARTYAQMTDAKADELIQDAFSYEKQRSELLAKYYGRMKDALGATTAARYVQIEHQLLLIIDLKLAASLPIVGSGS